MKIFAYGHSDQGQVRKRNEDRFLIFDFDTKNTASNLETKCNPHGALCLVIDGMGGTAGGEIAAETIHDTVLDFFSETTPKQSQAALSESLIRSNSSIRDIIKRKPILEGMGAVASSCLFYKDKIYISHIGDTRVYRQRDDKLALLTEDQTYVSELIRKGVLAPEDARTHPQKNVVLDAIGVKLHLEPAEYSFKVKSKDRYLLCSDGLYDLVEDSVISEMLVKTDNPKTLVKNLIKEANGNGGYDNITVIVVDVV